MKDDDILELRREIERLCDLATGDDGAGLPDSHPSRRSARAALARVADAINARKAGV